MQEIYIDRLGNGFPLVLVHGFLGSSDMWRFQKDFLKNNFSIISPALPGFGESFRTNSVNSIHEMASIIINSIKKLGIEKYHLMGHSMGGMIVQEMVKQSPTSVEKLICYGTGSIGDIPGRFEPIDVSRKRLADDGLKVTAHRIAKTWFVEEDKAKNFFLCEEAYINVSEKSADDALVAMKNWSGINNLKNINNETLIVWGEFDKAYNFNQVKTLNENISNSRLEIIKGCSHNVHLEKEDEFNKSIFDFLRS